MDRKVIITIILLVPVSIWLTLYSYYKYGKYLSGIKHSIRKKDEDGGHKRNGRN